MSVLFMLINKIKIKNGKGFTLLEVIIAIFLITVGVGATVSLINQTLSSSQVISSRLVASYLAQEGIELVRNIRDGNWLEGVDWLDGGLTLYLNSMAAIDYVNWPELMDSDHQDFYLCLGSGGFYYYDPPAPPPGTISCSSPASTLTPYQRIITLLSVPAGDPDPEAIRVLSEVKWTERGREHSITAEEILYNWR